MFLKISFLVSLFTATKILSLSLILIFELFFFTNKIINELKLLFKKLILRTIIFVEFNYYLLNIRRINSKQQHHITTLLQYDLDFSSNLLMISMHAI